MPPHKIFFASGTQSSSQVVSRNHVTNALLSATNKAKLVTQTRKLNMSHRLVTQSENLSCHTDAKTKICHTDLSHRQKTKDVTQTRKLNLPLRLVTQTENF